MPATAKPSFVEQVDRTALEFCIERYDTLPMRQTVKEDPETREKLIDYYNKLDTDGKVKITYKQSTDILERGRWFSVGPSLQNIAREIRHTIAGKYYYDLDLVNAHPVLLSQICAKKRIVCTKLNEYIENRESLFSQLPMSRDDSKKLILSIMNGGNLAFNKVKGRYQWVDEFAAEIKIILNKICKDDPEEFKKQKRRRIKEGKDYNYEGSYVNCLLCKAENQVLEAIAEYIEHEGWKIGTYMFDGLTIYRKANYDKFPIKTLVDCQQYVLNKTGFDVKIIEKEMTQGIKIPDDYECKYKRWKRKFEEKVAFIGELSAFIEINHNTNRYVIKSKDKLKITYEPEGDSLYKWLKDPLRKSYERIDFLPRPLENPGNVYNTYKCLAIEKHQGIEYIPSKAQPFYQLISQLMNHEQESINYFTNWLAHLIQFPGLKPNVAIIIQSMPGAGKGVLYELLNKVLGSEYCVSTADASNDLFGSFNGMIANKLLINLNEAREEDTMKYIELIKAYITEPTFQIKLKGKESYEVRNNARWIFYTNRDIPIKFQPGQRRFWGINSDNSKVNNKAWFAPIINALNDPEAIYAFYMDMMNLDVADYDFINNRPKTQFMQDIEDVSTDKMSEFIEYMKSANETQILEKNYIELESSEWYNDYKTFCRENNETDRLTQTTFSVRLCKKPGFEKIRKRNGMNIKYTPPTQM